MNKVDLQQLCTSPDQEWLAIPKDGTGLAYPVTRIDLTDDCVCVDRCGDRWWLRLSDCHLCQSTGYLDVDDKIYGGHIIQTRYRNKPAYGVVYWAETEWCIQPISDNWRGIRPMWRVNPREIIGHIHIPSEWPEEVRRLLE